MRDQNLQYYIHDESDAFRLELSGSLSGEGAQSVYQAWRTALSILGSRPVIVDITFVADADQRGRALLQLWHRRGARIIAASEQSRKLGESIVGEALPAIPVQAGWLARLRAAVRRSMVAAAGTSSDRHGISASPQKEATELIGASGRCRLECRMLL